MPAAQSRRVRGNENHAARPQPAGGRGESPPSWGGAPRGPVWGHSGGTGGQGGSGPSPAGAELGRDRARPRHAPGGAPGSVPECRGCCVGTGASPKRGSGPWIAFTPVGGPGGGHRWGFLPFAGIFAAWHSHGPWPAAPRGRRRARGRFSSASPARCRAQRRSGGRAGRGLSGAGSCGELRGAAASVRPPGPCPPQGRRGGERGGMAAGLGRPAPRRFLPDVGPAGFPPGRRILRGPGLRGWGAEGGKGGVGGLRARGSAPTQTPPPHPVRGPAAGSPGNVAFFSLFPKDAGKLSALLMPPHRGGGGQGSCYAGTKGLRPPQTPPQLCPVPKMGGSAPCQQPAEHRRGCR